MTRPYYLLLPLGAAIFYAVGAMFFKRALENGAGLTRTYCVNNWIMGLFFLPLILFEHKPVPWDQLHLPLIVAACFFAGHLLTFFAIRVGDVSLVTPILGVKVIFVALFVVQITGHPLPSELWIAAFLTTTAVFILGKTDIKPNKRLPLATCYTIGSAVCFSLCDVFAQQWAMPFGGFSFLSIMFVFVALFSFGMMPWFRRPLAESPKKSWGWMLGGAGFTSAQALLMASAIVFFNDATGVNIVYSSRGLWSIVLVWLIGHWFGNVEHKSGRSIVLARIAGTVLMTVAIVLAVRASSQ